MLAKNALWAETYNSGYSLAVTHHLTTNPPVRYLNSVEQMKSLAVSCPFTTKNLNLTVTSIATANNSKRNTNQWPIVCTGGAGPPRSEGDSS